MFWWTDRYIPGVAVPNYDQYGSLSYYALIAIIKLTFIAIPTFLFVSGFFIAYTSRGKQSALSWKVVRVRITNLLIPYLIWSVVFFAADFLTSCLDACSAQSLPAYLWALVSGGATEAYWYVPLIIQFFLLSLVLVPLTKANWKLAILIGALTQLGAIAVTYLAIFGINVPPIIAATFTTIFFPRDLIFFIIGVAAGFHFSALKQWLARTKWWLLAVWVVSIVLTLAEAEFFFRLNDGEYYLGHIQGGYFTIPMTIYVITFILTFLAFENVAVPFSTTVLEMGRRSYGIFLMHMLLIGYVMPKVVYHLLPWVLGHQIVYQPILIVSAIGLPYLFISFIAKSRFKGAYRTLFG